MNELASGPSGLGKDQKASEASRTVEPPQRWELGVFEPHILGRMRGPLWVIPCDDTRLLLELCHDLERRGLCRIERPERYEDGRVRCSLTRSGEQAIATG